MKYRVLDPTTTGLQSAAYSNAVDGRFSTVSALKGSCPEVTRNWVLCDHRNSASLTCTTRSNGDGPLAVDEAGTRKSTGAVASRVCTVSGKKVNGNSVFVRMADAEVMIPKRPAW